MFERKLNPQEARKQLLIAESETNRTLLAIEYENLADSIRQTIQPLKMIRAWLAKAASVMTVFNELRDHVSAPEKRWSFGRLLRMGLALWMGFQSKQP